MVRFAGTGGLSADSDVLAVVDSAGASLAFTEVGGKVVVTLPAGGGGNVDVLTTKGDLLTQSPSGTYVRVPLGGTVGMVLMVDASGVPVWTLPPGYQFDYVEVVSGTPTITATTAATAQAVITSNSVTYDGATRVKIEMFSYDANNAVIFELYDGSTDLGRPYTQNVSVGGNFLYGARFLTPSAGAHVYSFNAWKGGATNASFDVGAGGANTVLPMWMRITKA